MLRKARRSVQYLSLLFVVTIPFLSYLNTLRQVYGIRGFHIANLSGGWIEGTLYAMYELTFGRLDDPVALVDSIKGTFWSTTVSGFNISDPLAGIGYILATGKIYAPLLFSLLTPVVLTLIFGRAFCGWVCPINTIAEVVDKVRSGLQHRPSHRALDLDVGHETKYWILLAGVILTVVTGAPLFAYFLPYLILGREFYNIFLFQTLGAGACFLLVLALFEVFVSRRGWCRYLCPSGALLSMMGAFSLVRVVKQKGSSCMELCQDCEQVCPMALSVKEGKPGMECSLCGECVIACPQGDLGFVLYPRNRLRYGLLLLAVTVLFFAPPAAAHHVAGLPHYGYAENYPQVPLTEQNAQAGEYNVSFTTVFFQGIKRELSNIPFDTQFYIYIYNRTRDKGFSTAGFQNPFDPDIAKKTPKQKRNNPSYEGKLLLTIMDTGGNKVADYSLDTPAEESIYRFRHYFARPGDYKAMVKFFPQGDGRTASFPVSVETADRVPWLIISGLAVIIGFSMFLYYRKKRTPPVLSG